MMLARRGAAWAPTFVLTLAVTLGVTMPERGYAQTPQVFAQERFARGVQLFNAHNYSGALAEFRASMDLYASPNSRLYEARCLRELGRLGDSAAEFQRTVEEAADRARLDQRYALTYDEAMREFREVEPNVGRLAVNVPEAPKGVSLRIAGHPIPREGFGVPVYVTPGSVDIAVDAPGYLSERRRIQVLAGANALESIALRVIPEMPSATERTLRTLTWVVAGSASASITGFAVMGTLTQLQWNHIVQICPGQGGCPMSDWPQVEEGRTFQTSANAALGVGVALAAASAVLFIVWARLHWSPRRTVASGGP